jgi:glucose-1-phosphate adenylyltransferase
MAGPEYVLILSGDHVYKMDYRNMLNYHLLSGADATIGVLEIDRAQASSFGVVQTGRDNEITGFIEKPGDPEVLSGLPDPALVSMGIYVFRTDVLVDVLRDDAGDTGSSHDFGKDIIPRMLRESKRVFAYPFREKEHNEKPYWRDVGTLEAYYEANMDLVSVLPSLNLYDPDWPFRTIPFRIPPAKFVFNDAREKRIGLAINSIVCDGCIISGGQVFNSVLSTSVRINSFADVRDSIIMSGVNIGRHSLIKRSIIDKNVNIPPYTVIGYDLEEDRKRFTVTESGITVIPKDALIQQPKH